MRWPSKRDQGDGIDISTITQLLLTPTWLLPFIASLKITTSYLRETRITIARVSVLVVDARLLTWPC